MPIERDGNKIEGRAKGTVDGPAKPQDFKEKAKSVSQEIRKEIRTRILNFVGQFANDTSFKIWVSKENTPRQDVLKVIESELIREFGTPWEQIDEAGKLLEVMLEVKIVDIDNTEKSVKDIIVSVCQEAGKTAYSEKRMNNLFSKIEPVFEHGTIKLYKAYIPRVYSMSVLEKERIARKKIAASKTDGRMFKPGQWKKSTAVIQFDKKLSNRDLKAAQSSGSLIVEETNVKKEIWDKIFIVIRSIREMKPTWRQSSIQRVLRGTFGNEYRDDFIESMAKAFIEEMGKERKDILINKDFLNKIGDLFENQRVIDIKIDATIPKKTKIVDAKGKSKGTEVKVPGR